MYWEDANGGHHDVTKVSPNEKVSHIKENLDATSDMYIFQLQLQEVTDS